MNAKRLRLCRLISGFLLTLGWSAGAASAQEATTPANESPATARRAACVGDSITYGDRIPDRMERSYPAQLQAMLGSGWDVKNFGFNGATLLHAGDTPYIHRGPYADALKFRASVIVIALGTNDSKPYNWQHKEDFVPDYKSLIEAFRSASPGAEIYLCLPVYVVPPGNYDISESTIVNEVDPLIRQVAAEEHATVIDLHPLLEGKPQLLPDRIHPNAEGAGLLAAAVRDAIMHAAAASQPAARP